jgi:glucose/arabinose dehydrogenase
MLKKSFIFFVIASWLIIGIALYAPSSLAHPPWDPYDDTIFAPIKDFGPRIKVETIVKTDPAPGALNLTAPLKGVVAPGLPNHLFIVDQPGRIIALNLTTGAKTVVLDVGPDGLNLLVRLGVFFGPQCPPDQASTGPSFDERGLLGLAFHPNFATNGKFYTYTSEPVDGVPTFPTTLPPGTPPDHQNVLSEWTAVNPANPAAGVRGPRRVLMRVDWPQFNHDGGDLAFGPDGQLFISMGDGGGADDQDGQLDIVPGSCGAQAPIVGHGEGEGNAQNLTRPLGKILRIDVNPPFSPGKEYKVPDDNPFVGLGGVIQEIFAFGFRNPFRFSFDKVTGQLFVGDVGQNDIEEVDLVVSGGNYGWNRKEGALCFDANGNEPGFAFEQDPCPNEPSNLIDPIAQYDTHHEGHSVIGGFVYHGSQVPELKNWYIFGDFANIFKFPSGPHDYGRLFHIPRPAGKPKSLLQIREFQIQGGNSLGLALLGFGQDANGEIYVLGNVSGLPFGTQGVVLRLAWTDD